MKYRSCLLRIANESSRYDEAYDIVQMPLSKHSKDF